MTITGIVHVNVNCSNFERSQAFYELLGFERILDVAPTSSPEVAAAVGMPPYRVNGALFLLHAGGQPFVLDLLEWQEPTDPAAPYPHLYHLGIARIALSTDDLAGDMDRLKSAGVEFLSEPVSLTLENQRTTTFVCFRDPDGTVLELVESRA